jgi:hypothetical protein
MTLDETALRQWLALLQQSFLRAEWDDDIWPGWLLPLDPAGAPAGLRLN